MGFAAGDRVHLAGLGTGIILEARGGDRYAIDIKGRVVIAAGRDLENAGTPPSTGRSPRPMGGEAPTDVRPRPAPSLDLHGMTVDQALDALHIFVNDALVSGCGGVRIIHGKSGGRLKAAVHQALRRLPVVADVRLDSQNPGVTIVRFV